MTMTTKGPHDSMPSKQTILRDGLPVVGKAARKRPDNHRRSGSIFRRGRAGLGLRERMTLSQSKKRRRVVSFCTPVVTRVRFIDPADDDGGGGGGGGGNNFELFGLEQEIQSYRRRALIDSQMNSRSRSVREKATLVEAEMNDRRRRWRKHVRLRVRVRRVSRRTSSSSPPPSSQEGTASCQRDGCRVSFAAPLCRVRWFCLEQSGSGASSNSRRADLFYSEADMCRFRAGVLDEARASGRDLTAIEQSVPLLVESREVSSGMRIAESSEKRVARRRNLRQVVDSNSGPLASPPSLQVHSREDVFKAGIDNGEMILHKNRSSLPHKDAVKIENDVDWNGKGDHRLSLKDLEDYTVSLAHPSGIIVEV